MALRAESVLVERAQRDVALSGAFAEPNAQHQRTPAAPAVRCHCGPLPS